MRKIFALAAAVLLAAMPAASAEAAEAGARCVRFSFDGYEATAELLDNAAADSFWKMLPAVLDFEDFNGTERIAYTKEKISSDGAPSGYAPKAGDITLYAPWGNIAVFYKDFRDSPGLVPMGRFVSGLEHIAKLGKGVRAERQSGKM